MCPQTEEYRGESVEVYQINSAVAASNSVLLSSICAPRHTEHDEGTVADGIDHSGLKRPNQTRIRIADGYSWAFGRCDFYDDAVHHSRLGASHVMAVLEDMCDPREGIRRSKKPYSSVPPKPKPNV